MIETAAIINDINKRIAEQHKLIQFYRMTLYVNFSGACKIVLRSKQQKKVVINVTYSYMSDATRGAEILNKLKPHIRIIMRDNIVKGMIITYRLSVNYIFIHSVN